MGWGCVSKELPDYFKVEDKGPGFNSESLVCRAGDRAVGRGSGPWGHRVHTCGRARVPGAPCQGPREPRPPASSAFRVSPAGPGIREHHGPAPPRLHPPATRAAGSRAGGGTVVARAVGPCRSAVWRREQHRTEGLRRAALRAGGWERRSFQRREAAGGAGEGGEEQERAEGGSRRGPSLPRPALNRLRGAEENEACRESFLGCAPQERAPGRHRQQRG